MVKWKFWKKSEKTCSIEDHDILEDQNRIFQQQISVVIAQKELLQEELEYFRYKDVDKDSYT